MKMWFHRGLQGHLNHHLGDAIRYCRYAQRPLASITLRYLYRSHWRREVAP